MSGLRRFPLDVLMPKNWTSHHMFRAFQYKNYRLFFSGQTVSLLGLWMQRVAMSWLIYRLTGSSFYLGLADFVGPVPVLFLGFFAGALLEGWDLRKSIMGCQVLSMFQAFVLAVLTLTGNVAYWHILSLSVFLGVVNAFDVPARQAFVIHLVTRQEDVGNAVALNSSLFNAARLVGPSIAGILIAFVGEGFCFLANALSYGASLWALSLVRLTPCTKEETLEALPVRQRITQGVAYAWATFPIRAILILLVVVSFFGLPYLTMLPIFAGEILHGGSQGLGFLLGATGLGALGVSIYFAMRSSPVGLGKVLGLGVCLLGGSIVLFASSSWFYLSFCLMFFIGAGMVSILICCNTLLQNLVEEGKRSRIMSLYIVAVVGIAPFGSLVTGWVASLIGAPLTLGGGGLICLGAGILFLKKHALFWAHASRIYKIKGFLD